MEISLREWLIIGGIVVIALILVDGWRRIRANRNRLRIDIDKTISDIGEGKHHNPELPNGGARVSSFNSEDVSVEVTQTSQPKYDLTKKSSPVYKVKPDSTPLIEQESPIPTLHEINPAEHDEPKADAFEAMPDRPPLSDYSDDKAQSRPSPVEPTEAKIAPANVKRDTELELQTASSDDSGSSEPSRVTSEAELKSEPAASVTEPVPDKAEDSKADYSGFDPLFDEIPSNTFDREPAGLSAQSKDDTGEAEPNLYLDLDLEQPIHQIMANKSANKSAGKEVDKNSVRRTAEKPRRRQTENPSFTLPLDEPEEDMFSDMGLSALEAELDAETPLGQSFDTKENAADAPGRSAKPHNETQTTGFVATKPAAAATRKALSDMPDPDEMLVITVVGRDRQKLPGVPLQKVVEACGMEFGDMSIYHRFEGDATASSLQFSMANAVNPGTFDPEAMEALETPAVSFFMSMREPKDPMTAYECMLATAETLAKHLDGDLLDEDRSVMREQTKEHYRQRIRDFEMQSRRRKLGR